MDFMGNEKDSKSIVLKLIFAFIIFLAMVLVGLLFGFIGLVFDICIAIVLLLVMAYLLHKEKGVKALEREQAEIKEAIKAANKKFMHRKISEKTFREFNEQKQKELLGVEALMDAKKVEKSIEELCKKKSSKLSAKRKHKLGELIRGKNIVLKELSLAMKRYLKRKIDDKTYRNIVKSQQKKLLEIEAKIAGLYKEEAREIMKQTERELETAMGQEWEKEKDEAAEELFEQFGEKEVRRTKRRRGERAESEEPRRRRRRDARD